MKIIKKVFLVLCLFLFSLNCLNAEENKEEWDIHCDEATNDKTKQGCWDTIKYCWQDQESEYTGCPFDPNNEYYATTKLPINRMQFEDESFKLSYSYMDDKSKSDIPGLPSNPHDAYANGTGLKFRIYRDIRHEKAYAASDGDGKAATIVCYKGWVKVRNNIEIDTINGEGGLFDVVPNKCSGPDCLGAAYVFKIFKPTSTPGVCSASIIKLLLSEDITYKFSHASGPNYGGKILQNYPDVYWNTLSNAEKNNLRIVRIEELNTNPSYSLTDNSLNATTGLGVDTNYHPTDTSGCPPFLNVNPNGNKTNHYRVGATTDTTYDSDFATWLNNVFTGNYKDGTAYSGCTTEDTVGYDEMLKCFEEQESKIKAKSCPSDLSSFKDFVSDLDNLQSKCKKQYKELYAKFLMDKDNKDYDAMLKKYVNEKIDSCYYSSCKLNSNDIKAVNNALSKKERSYCAQGCSLTKIPSDINTWDDNGKCYVCGYSSGATYKWSTTSLAPQCQENDSISKTQCFGTDKDKTCLECYKSAYRDSGIDESKITCLIDSLFQREQNKVQANVDINSQSSEYTNETAHENASAASDTFQSTFIIPAPGGGSFGRSASCQETMGGEGGAAYKIINGSVNIIRILAPIVAIVNAMIVLMPAITAKDETGLKKATHKCVIIGVVLLIIEVFPYVVRLIGAVFGFDLSCIG